MKIVEIREEAGLYDLRPAWDSLLRGSAGNTIFLSWEWLTAWWRSYGKTGELRILTASDENGALRGIAPLRLQTMRKYGQKYSALAFVGDGSMDSDYLDFIVASGHEEQVLETFHRHCLGQQEHDGILLINEIPAASPNVPFLRQMAVRDGLIWREKDVPCGTVRLPQTWEAYLGTLKPRFRTKVRSVLRNLESRADVRFRFCETTEHLERLLPALFDLHSMRWQREGKPGVFGFPGKRDFYFALSRLFLDRNWLRFSWLEWNGRILACQYGFEYAGKYFQLQEGYETAAEHWNVGIGLRAWSIQQFLKQGVREYDFLGGVGQHKTDWGAETTNSKQILVARSNWKNLLLARGPEWERSTKEFIKTLVPAYLLAARDARLEQRRRPKSESPADTPETPEKDWKRKVAAACYFHFGIPAIMRPLRGQYRLSLNSGGNKKISWSRRSQPSARILYYHRVNDDNDPFFPSISRVLFEKEIRYLAGNYKVVSLTNALSHLHGGSPETVLSITFDDGYQDNYQYAFPILQRYGVPATIFLTTGSLDSRDPLWFEQLARAVKMTERDYIDLEIDLPRRFKLSTQAERLEANTRIFSLLRSLTDSERREGLVRILRELAVQDHGDRKDKMLTWDQVRMMTGHGIEFGGHTVTHPFISRLSRDRVLWEASECKRRIEDELQIPADYFAYPNGREEDFGLSNKALIQEVGYRAAVTTIWGVNYSSTDPFELRRGGPWEDSPAMFAYKLDWYDLVEG
jgi:peptidoglycan/xylan/chitin deacetylase (PgdA/CDA1 family)/CelD/BcsL family acetyltransferase involved in cellulose biosynthesis